MLGGDLNTKTMGFHHDCHCVAFVASLKTYTILYRALLPSPLKSHCCSRRREALPSFTIPDVCQESCTMVTCAGACRCITLYKSVSEINPNRPCCCFLMFFVNLLLPPRMCQQQVADANATALTQALRACAQLGGEWRMKTFMRKMEVRKSGADLGGEQSTIIGVYFWQLIYNY